MLCKHCEEAEQAITKKVFDKLIPLMFSLHAGTAEDFNKALTAIGMKMETTNSPTTPLSNSEDLETQQAVAFLVNEAKSREASEIMNIPINFTNDENEEKVSTSIENEVEVLKVQVQEIVLSKSNDEKLKNKVEVLEEVLKTTIEQNENDNLKRDEEIKSLKCKNQILFEKNDGLEQYGRRMIGNIEEIPVEKGENVLKVAQDFFQDKLGVRVHESEISACHRTYFRKSTAEKLGINPSCPPIYVKFVRRDLKNLLMRRRYLLKNQYNRYGKKYQFSENLTLFRRNLLSDVKEKLKHWRYIWIRSGDIWARKDKWSKSVKIINNETLDYIISKESSENYLNDRE